MKTALITGGAARIGAQIAKTLHDNNFKIIIHCNHSKGKAQHLCESLNSIRKIQQRSFQETLITSRVSLQLSSLLIH
jgi:pteridine reductase